MNTSGFIVEIVDFEPTLVRMWSPVVIRIEQRIGLLGMLNELNANGLGLRIFHTEDQVVLATELVAETLDTRELHFACHLLAGAAERLGPELVALYGGQTLFPTRDGMLSHLDDPTVAIAEARRVLMPGGIFFACTRARTSDPELTGGYPPTTFDAEEAPGLVAAVFGEHAMEVIGWDAPLLQLPDREAIAPARATSRPTANIAQRASGGTPWRRRAPRRRPG